MTSSLGARPLPDRPVDALAHARELEAAGAPDDAIDLLMQINRRRRNAKVERELVLLRHRAFGASEAAPGFPGWPVDTHDIFGPGASPPEVRGSELTAAHVRSAILHHGCLVVRDLIPPARVEQLTSDIDRALDAAKAHIEGASSKETAPWWVPFKPKEGYSVGGGREWIWEQGSVWAVDSPRSLFDLVETFREIGLDQTIAAYLGESPALSVKKCTLRRVPASTGTNWHQDGAFLGDGIRTLNVWVALSPCGEDSPSLDIVPRRMERIIETGTDGALFDWSVGEDAVDRARGDAPIVRPHFEAGDAMLFDEMFLHRTGVSAGMTRDRYTIESWFFAPSTYPDEQIPVMFSSRAAGGERRRGRVRHGPRTATHVADVVDRRTSKASTPATSR